jgi:flagellar basal body-associated protein FliL
MMVVDEMAQRKGIEAALGIVITIVVLVVIALAVITITAQNVGKAGVETSETQEDVFNRTGEIVEGLSSGDCPAPQTLDPVTGECK